MNAVFGISYVTLIAAICKIQASALCPLGSLYNFALEMCYWPSPNNWTYHDHVAGCAADGGILLTIPDENVYEYVYDYIPWTQWFTSPHDVYLGMYDVFDSGTFYHIIEQPDEQTFLPWSNGGQPAPWGYIPDQDCGIIDESRKFQDKTCTDRYSAVCSKTALSSAKCPTSKFLFYNETCFWPQTTIQGAEDHLKACLADGGTLAVIRDQQTLDEVTNKFNDWFGSNVNAYVGYNDYEEERTFRESFFVKEITWSKWSPGEPSAASDERCVEMYHTNGDWNALFCTDLKQAVCQKHVSSKMFTTIQQQATTKQQKASTEHFKTTSEQKETTTAQEETTTSEQQETTTIIASKQMLLSTYSVTTEMAFIQTSSSWMASTSDSILQQSTAETISDLSTTARIPLNAINLNINKDFCALAATDCLTNFTWSSKVVNERIAFLRRNLRIKRNSTKAYRRTKYSPYEDEPVPFGLGVVGIIVIVSVAAVFIILDLTYKLKPK